MKTEEFMFETTTNYRFILEAPSNDSGAPRVPVGLVQAAFAVYNITRGQWIKSRRPTDALGSPDVRGLPHHTVEKLRAIGIPCEGEVPPMTPRIFG